MPVHTVAATLVPSSGEVIINTAQPLTSGC